jgi:hypothetical protein
VYTGHAAASVGPWPAFLASWCSLYGLVLEFCFLSSWYQVILGGSVSGILAGAG